MLNKLCLPTLCGSNTPCSYTAVCPQVTGVSPDKSTLLQQLFVFTQGQLGDECHCDLQLQLLFSGVYLHHSPTITILSEGLFVNERSFLSGSSKGAQDLILWSTVCQKCKICIKQQREELNTTRSFL